MFKLCFFITICLVLFNINVIAYEKANIEYGIKYIYVYTYPYKPCSNLDKLNNWNSAPQGSGKSNNNLLMFNRLSLSLPLSNHFSIILEHIYPDSFELNKLSCQVNNIRISRVLLKHYLNYFNKYKVISIYSKVGVGKSEFVLNNKSLRNNHFSLGIGSDINLLKLFRLNLNFEVINNFKGLLYDKYNNINVDLSIPRQFTYGLSAGLKF